MKKSLFIIFCIVLATFSIVSAVNVIGTLSYWHSNDGRIGWWSPSATFSTTTTINGSTSFLSR